MSLNDTEAEKMVAEAKRYVRTLAAADPNVLAAGKGVFVANIETSISPGALLLDLSDGTTIRLDIDRYVR